MAVTAMTDIPIDTLTTGSASPDAVLGTGVFDVMMKAIKAQLEIEYNENRIVGDKYADVYLGSMQTALTQAVLFTMQRPMVERQAVTEESKKALVDRQTKGFDDDAKQKLMKQMLDSWSVAYSVAKDANSIPDTIKVNPIDNVTKSALVGLGIMQQSDTVMPSNPLGEI